MGFGATLKSKTNIFSMVRFNDIMTDTVNILENKVDVNHTSEGCNMPPDVVSSDMVKNKLTVPCWGGTVPQERS